MSPSKEEIKNWLKKIRKDRFWLAEKCNTGKRAVDKWFEKNGAVPAKAILVIRSLMSDATQPLPSPDQADDEIDLRVVFRGPQKDIVEAFIQRFPDVSLPEYCRDKTLELCIGMEQSRKQTDQERGTLPAADYKPSGGETYSNVLKVSDEDRIKVAERAAEYDDKKTSPVLPGEESEEESRRKDEEYLSSRSREEQYFFSSAESIDPEEARRNLRAERLGYDYMVGRRADDSTAPKQILKKSSDRKN